MKSTDKITPAEAIEVAAEYGVSVTTETIRDWCDDKHIGKKIVGRYYINRKRLIWLLEGRAWENTKEENKNQ